MNDGEISLAKLKVPRHVIDAELYKIIQPEDFLARYLEEGIRIDGRPVSEGTGQGGADKKGKGLGKRADDDALDWRPVTIDVGSISSAAGSSLVRLGKTIVVCGVQAEVAAPSLGEPKEGYVVPNVDLGPLCHSRFKPGPPSPEAQILSIRLSNALTSKELPFLPLDALCIEAGKAVWCIYVSVICLNDDGNIFDAALLAAVAALINTRIPPVLYSSELDRVCTISGDRHVLSLAHDRIPLSFSFRFFDCAVLLPDPTAFEENVSQASICITLSGSSADKGGATAILAIEQSGSGGSDHRSSFELVQFCIQEAKIRFASIITTLRDVTNPK